MPAVMVDIRARPRSETLGLIQAYSHVVIEVGDIGRSQDFYGRLLGFNPAGETPEGPRLNAGERQFVVLAQRAQVNSLPETGVHYAYKFPPDALELVLAGLARAGVEVHDYHEDRPAELGQNRYCSDPDGHRIQLVSGDVSGIDHVALETHDLEWAETFYTHVLGGCVEARVGWHMRDFAKAQEWDTGGDKCAPGTRRRDKLYTTIQNKATVARPNAQVFMNLHAGVTFGQYLATEHRQEPPLDQFKGTPRVGFRLAAGGLAELEERLRKIRLRCMPVNPQTGGPFERSDNALFVRDPGGNFLEFGA